MDYQEKVDVLVEALPYVNRFNKNIIVVKYGGNAMVNDELKVSVMQDILLMKSVGMQPVLVHGGGPFISEALDQFNIKSEFKQGIRVTSQEAMDVVEMVLAGSVNNEIVRLFNHLGGRAVGLSGVDAGLLKVSKYEEAGLDYGYVGDIQDVNIDLILELLAEDYVPIISSIGLGEDGQAYNINADTVASSIAQALDADKFILLTDVEGVMKDPDDAGSLISKLSMAEAKAYIEDGTIQGGMIPKLECCLDAIDQGVQAAHIIDGRRSHSILLEVFFDVGIGTMITKERVEQNVG